MLDLFANIFKGFNISDAMKQTDDWKLTKEETIKYQLEWLRAMPTGFQLAQRLIGVAFSAVFLLLVIATFIMLLFGHEISMLMEFIKVTMAQPLMIIFSLFFGGGLINSFKNGGKGWSQQVAVENSKRGIKPSVEPIFSSPKPIEELSRREKRALRKQQKQSK